MTILAATLPDNGGYVAGAFLVFLTLLLVYFAIMAIRLSRIERELVDLNAELEARPAPAAGDPVDS